MEHQSGIVDQLACNLQNCDLEIEQLENKNIFFMLENKNIDLQVYNKQACPLWMGLYFPERCAPTANNTQVFTDYSTTERVILIGRHAL